MPPFGLNNSFVEKLEIGKWTSQTALGVGRKTTD
jgi:hypothetical protein